MMQIDQSTILHCLNMLMIFSLILIEFSANGHQWTGAAEEVINIEKVTHHQNNWNRN